MGESVQVQHLNPAWKTVGVAEAEPKLFSVLTDFENDLGGLVAISAGPINDRPSPPANNFCVPQRSREFSCRRLPP